MTYENLNNRCIVGVDQSNLFDYNYPDKVGLQFFIIACLNLFKFCKSIVQIVVVSRGINFKISNIQMISNSIF